MNNLSSVLIVLVSFYLAYYLRFGAVTVETNYLLALLTSLLLTALVFPATGAFREQLRNDMARRMRRIIAGWALVAGTLVALSAIIKVTSMFSRIWFGNWVLFTSVGLALGLFITHFVRKRSARLLGKKRKLVLVGLGPFARELEDKLESAQARQFELIGKFGDPAAAGFESVSELSRFVSQNPVDDVWISFSLGNPGLLDEALAQLKESVVDIHLIPDIEHYRLLNQDVSEWEGLPFINLSGTPMVGSERLLKSCMDRVGSALLLLLLSPLLLVIASILWLSSGRPIIFAQKRHGMDGRPIAVYKFRTMTVNEKEPFTQARPGDHRTTWFGRLLRRSSLDELPQLFNVLKGEMSLVGPRPHPVELDAFFRERIPRYMLRNKALPGMTGWAQVNGLRGLTETDEKMALRIEHDLWYIQNWSIWLDITILMRTPFVMIHKNAY